MKNYISDMRSLRNYVDGVIQDRLEDHSEQIERAAREIADQRPEGLHWGEDWSNYLATIDIYSFVN